MSRPNKVQAQLRLALEDAESAMRLEASDELAISRIKLSQTRLVILNQIASRHDSAKIRKLKKEVNGLRAENERLKSEVARLAHGQASAHPTAVEINEVLRKYGQGGKDAV